MAFDIYGNNLTPGYCEVHPWIHEEYPCHECAKEQYRREMMAQMEEEYYAEQMHREHEAELEKLNKKEHKLCQKKNLNL